MTLMTIQYMKEILQRLRICRNNEQNQLIISGNLPQGRAITPKISHKVATSK